MASTGYWCFYNNYIEPFIQLTELQFQMAGAVFVACPDARPELILVLDKLLLAWTQVHYKSTGEDRTR